MTDTPLATVAQLGAYLGQTIEAEDPTAVLLLDIASGMVRDHLQSEITEAANDVVVLDPLDGSYVLLPEGPVTAVSQLETYSTTTLAWSTVAATNYTVSLHQGIIAAVRDCGIQWPGTPGSWRATYTHGYATVPMSLVGVCLGVAARAWVSPVGVSAESLGGYSVKYAMEAEGFTSLEMKALARYQQARVA